jgi:hypothetical protein
MAAFMTRVELHSATWADYNTLHAAMEAQGFSRQITADDGQAYHLPTAEYYFVGNVTRSQVLAKAQAAAASTGKSYAALVTESNGVTWVGLALV